MSDQMIIGEKPSISQGAAAVDKHPRPKRTELSIVAIMDTASRASREAAAKVTDGKQERALVALLKVMRLIEPTDVCTSTLDGWARIGAVEGARAAWCGTPVHRPNGAPSVEHAFAYSSAATVAWGCVLAAKATKECQHARG